MLKNCINGLTNFQKGLNYLSNDDIKQIGEYALYLFKIAFVILAILITRH